MLLNSIAIVTTMGLVTAFPISLRATVIASENFNYSNSYLNGQNGGTGWTDAWISDQGTPTVTNQQANINAAAGTQVERSIPLQGSGSTIWIRFTVQQFTTASTNISNYTYGGFGIYSNSTELALIGKAWGGAYLWTEVLNGSAIVSSNNSTLTPSVVYLEVATDTYSSMLVQGWINPTNPAIIATKTPDMSQTFGSSGWNTIRLRGGTDGSVSKESWIFTNIMIVDNPTNIGVMPPPPLPSLSNSLLQVKFNYNGTINSMLAFRSNAWNNISFRTDIYAGPAWRLNDNGGTRSDLLTLTYPTPSMLTNNVSYTNVVFAGYDSANTNLQLALQYQLSGTNQMETTASITNMGTAAWSPIQAGILMGLDTYMVSYPSWDYIYFPTMLRCEKTHFWGYVMTPLGRTLGIGSPNPVASWHNEYDGTASIGGGGHRIYTFGLDFLNELPLPVRHPQNLTTLQPGQGMSWNVFI
ncbi:MAG TPA: hypothetical protein VNX46_13125, partial [Candidatus Acidoferrum sp.]|nr:hypothetical protein [Candidatus Acidoferrum sp.]